MRLDLETARARLAGVQVRITFGLKLSEKGQDDCKESENCEHLLLPALGAGLLSPFQQRAVRNRHVSSGRDRESSKLTSGRIGPYRRQKGRSRTKLVGRGKKLPIGEPAELRCAISVYANTTQIMASLAVYATIEWGLSYSCVIGPLQSTLDASPLHRWMGLFRHRGGVRHRLRDMSDWTACRFRAGLSPSSGFQSAYLVPARSSIKESRPTGLFSL